MSQVMTAASTQAQRFHARAAAATVADLMRLPPATVSPYDHAAAAAYLMKHAGATALMVTDARTSQPPASSPRRTSPARSRTGKTSTTSGSTRS